MIYVCARQKTLEKLEMVPEEKEDESYFDSSEEADKLTPDILLNYVSKTDYIFLLDKVSELSKIIG